MPLFRATSIIDGDTFEVSPEWKWNGETGTRVRAAGYDAPTAYSQRTESEGFINGQQVELSTAHKVGRGQLVCEVFVGSRNLAEFFPEYRELYEIETSELIRRILYVCVVAPI
ncbi:thermonuclease family protein [Pectobacterium odoriferum]|uniref:thermonuclease family protein n=1 Tax=Pectobacterium odoriferum TaxID=78398 RepID=UPI000D464943|nr:thermonuclease family protein [Pectobacterium odoriferum]POD89103.1 hypothetical protein BV925_23360 [Pectobacterium odoriferum]